MPQNFSALRVQTLNAGYICEATHAGVVGGSYQQPWDGIGLRGVHMRRRLSGNLTPVFVLPGGTGEVVPDHSPLRIMKIGLRSFEGPLKCSVGPLFAGVDLEARGVGLENQLHTCWDLQRFGNSRYRTRRPGNGTQ